jgi:hypothetical protein
MTQSGMVCLQAATVLLMAQALIRASPLAEKFLRQSLPDEPASGTPPSCLEVALKESFDNNPPDPKFLVQLLAPVSHTHREGVIVAFLTALTQPALQARLGIVGVSMDIINGLEYLANGVTVPAGQISQPHWPTRVCCLHALLLQFFQIPGNVNDPALRDCETLSYYPALPAEGDHTVLVRATAALNAHITKLWDT